MVYVIRVTANVFVCLCVRQLRLPRHHQCAGVQLRLLTDSRGDRSLERVNRTTPHSLLLAAESCAGQVKVGMTPELVSVT